MPLYGENEFIGINAACVQAGQPIDALVERLFWQDEKWLLVRGNWFMHGLWRQQLARDQSGGDRAYASTRESCIFVAPYLVQPTLASVDVVICGRVNTEAPSPENNTIRIKAEMAGVGIISAAFSATANYTALRLTIPITQRPARPFATQLRIWVTSQPTGDISDAPPEAASYPQFPGEFVQDGLYGPEDQPAPDPTTHNTQATVTPQGYSDHIVAWQEDRMILYPAPAALPLGQLGARVYLSYLQMRGFTLREVHQAAVYPPEEIRALIPFLGQTAAQHPVALLSALTRPQLVSLGHPGQLDYSRCTGMDLPEGYTTPFQWRAVLAGEGYQTVHRQPLLLDEARGRLEIRILYIPVYVVGDYARGEDKALRDDSTLADWTFYAGLFTFSDGSGSPSALEERGAEIAAIQHLPTDQSGVWPFLLQRRWAGAAAYAQYVTTPDLDLVELTRDASYAPGTERPTNKEGHLYGPDFPLVQEVVVSVPLDGVPTDKATCLEILAGQIGAAPTFRTPTSEADADDPNRVQLVIVGLSVWAHYANGVSEPVTHTGKQIAAEAGIPPLLRYASGGKVRALDWQALCEQANRLWVRRGSRGIGRWFKEGSDQGDPWVTASTGLTTNSGYTGVNERLSNTTGPVWTLHDVEPAANRVRLYLEAHGSDVDLEVQVYALDDGALLGTLTASASGWQLMSDVLELNLTAAHEGDNTANPRRLMLIEVRAATNDTLAKLTYWQLREEPITDPADLPA